MTYPEDCIDVRIPDEDCFDGIRYHVWLDYGSDNSNYGPDSTSHSPFSAEKLQDAVMLAKAWNDRATVRRMEEITLESIRQMEKRQATYPISVSVGGRVIGRIAKLELHDSKSFQEKYGEPVELVPTEHTGFFVSDKRTLNIDKPSMQVLLGDDADGEGTA